MPIQILTASYAPAPPLPIFYGPHDIQCIKSAELISEKKADFFMSNCWQHLLHLVERNKSTNSCMFPNFYGPLDIYC